MDIKELNIRKTVYVRGKIYRRRLKFYKDNVCASVTNSMSGSMFPNWMEMPIIMICRSVGHPFFLYLII